MQIATSRKDYLAGMRMLRPHEARESPYLDTERKRVRTRPTGRHTSIRDKTARRSSAYSVSSVSLVSSTFDANDKAGWGPQTAQIIATEKRQNTFSALKHDE